MIAEIGHFAMILSLGLGLLLSVLPLYGAARNNTLLMNSARPLSWGMFGFLVISFFILCYAFYTNDFTVQYVASNSNSQLPWYYRITAVWGAHEGSLLLWVLIQAGLDGCSSDFQPWYASRVCCSRTGYHGFDYCRLFAVHYRNV